MDQLRLSNKSRVYLVVSEKFSERDWKHCIILSMTSETLVVYGEEVWLILSKLKYTRIQIN